MIWNGWALLPFLIHNTIMMIDEFYYHHKRILPRWEKLGHPADTVTYIFCLGLVLFLPHQRWTILYLCVALFSTLFVFKDMPIHAHYCSFGEKCLHGLMYFLHPLQLLILGVFHQQINIDSSDLIFFQKFLWVQFSLALLTCVYQIVYWNFGDASRKVVA